MNTTADPTPHKNNNIFLHLSLEDVPGEAKVKKIFESLTDHKLVGCLGSPSQLDKFVALKQPPLLWTWSRPSRSKGKRSLTWVRYCQVTHMAIQ
jgi:hypothetical protein